MKNTKSIIVLLTGILFAASCSEDDKLTVEVQEAVTRGAILRTISLPNPTFDFNDPQKEWIVEIEEQDHEDGELFMAIDLYASITSAADGMTSAEAFVKTIPASSFSPGPNQLPRGLVAATLAEVLSALGLQAGDFSSTDSFNLRLELLLADGRSFTNTDAVGTVTGGSFFSTPYIYSAQFFCALEDASLFDGNFVVTNDIWADYSVGDVVPVEFVSGYTFRVLSANNPFINNPDSSYMEFTINPADGSVTVTSNECFDYGPGFCLDVTGSGSIGTCTGDINVVLDFGGFTNNGFSLIKQ